jgi:hypothetical protein
MAPRPGTVGPRTQRGKNKQVEAKSAKSPMRFSGYIGLYEPLARCGVFLDWRRQGNG